MPRKIKFPSAIDRKVTAIDSKLMSADERYQKLDKESVSLEELKQAKKEQLDYLCTQDVLYGFSFTLGGISYRFSFDVEAQANFTGTKVLFLDGSITEVEWTAYENEVAKRIVITESDFNILALTAFVEKDRKIKRYRNDLLPLVEAATTLEEVEAVVW